jgi:glycopeptide antibiotics resistance protein
MEHRKRLLPPVLTVLVALIAIAYVLALLKITVVKATTLSRVFENVAAGKAPLRSVNLVPFETVLTYLRFRENMPFLRWFSNIFGNVLVFVPLGLYLPATLPAMRRFNRTLAAIVFVSVSLEALQYLLGTGSTDIDDVWLNAAGGSLGYVLYVIVARVSTRRIPAAAWVLALSVCFGVAGYAVAYREFGVYLGLATFREEVHGDSQIPRRPADAFGIVTGSRGDRLLLSVIGRPAGTRPPAAGGTPTGPDRNDIEVRVGASTRFFDRQSSDKGHTQVTSYLPYTPAALSEVPENTQAHVWGRWEADHLAADVIWTMRPRQATGMAAGAPPPAATPAAVSMVAAPGGLTLPTSAAALFGHTGSKSSSTMPFKGAVGDEVTVYKIRSWQDDRSKFAVATADPATFRLTPETVYYRQRILRGGREVYVTPGSREDIVAGKTIRVWGSEREGVLVAEAVCVITAAGR